MPAGSACFVRTRLADGTHEPRLRPQREHALHVQLAFARPRPPAVLRGEDGGATRGMASRRSGRGRAHGEDEVALVGRVHDRGLDGRVLAARIERIVAGEHAVGVIAPAVLDRVLRRVRKDHAPGAAGVHAAPERAIRRVEDAGIARVEGEALHHPPEVEHPPALAGVAGEVGTGHVAAKGDQACVVGADGGTAHGAAAARTDDRPGILPGRGPGRAGRAREEEAQEGSGPATVHARNSSSRRRTHSAISTDCLDSRRLGEGVRPAPRSPRNASYSP